MLVGYDYLRGAAETMGMPTWWSPQLDIDKALFGGTVPTVWLQAHFRYPDVRWWDVGATLCYVSFFFAPYLLAGMLWLRSRAEFRRWALRFVCVVVPRLRAVRAHSGGAAMGRRVLHRRPGSRSPVHPVLHRSRYARGAGRRDARHAG